MTAELPKTFRFICEADAVRFAALHSSLDRRLRRRFWTRNLGGLIMTRKPSCEPVLAMLASLAVLGTVTAEAAKPVDSTGVPFGNGFPSGPHYNLNLSAKQDNFTCPEPSYDELGNQEFGKVIFFPRVQNDDPITILMESGTKGPKGAPETATLEVTDWCTESFPDYGQMNGDGAVLRLPYNANGYAVYGTLGGKPLKDGEPTISIAPDLYYVEDENGNDLILLGMVDSSGTATFGSDGTVLYRTDSSGTKKGKGSQKASNLTSLFEYTGEICYVQTDPSAYCYDEFGMYTCTTQDLCCVDENSDSIYEACDLLTNVGDLLEDGTTLACPSDPLDDPYLPIAVSAECQSYDNEFVFNIADFVGYLWDIDTTGTFLVRIRFYPIL
jgi:hypothetical protein